MKNLFRIVLILFAFTITEIARAQDADISNESRPVTGIYSIEWGHKNVLATYLSPLHYSGSNIGLSGEWSKAMPFNPQNAIMRFHGGMDFSNLLNPAQTARMIGLNAYFNWGMEWRRKLPKNFQFTLGGAASLKGGAYYLLRNGNNPVQAMGNVSIDVTGSLSKAIRYKKLNLLIEDQVSVPSLSLFFMPEYGETYYEIYLGNTSHLVHGGWWGNNFSLNNLLSFTFDFGRTAAMIGYRFNMQTAWANYLNTKIFSHSLVVGIIPGGLGLKKKVSRVAESTVYADF